MYKILLAPALQTSTNGDTATISNHDIKITIAINVMSPNRRCKIYSTELIATYPATWSNPRTADSFSGSTRTTSSPGSGTHNVFPALVWIRLVRSFAESRLPARSIVSLKIKIKHTDNNGIGGNVFSYGNGNNAWKNVWHFDVCWTCAYLWRLS